MQVGGLRANGLLDGEERAGPLQPGECKWAASEPSEETSSRTMSVGLSVYPPIKPVKTIDFRDFVSKGRRFSGQDKRNEVCV